MNCAKCGKENEFDSKFCIYCGVSLINQESYSNGNLEPFEKDGKWGFKDDFSRDVIILPKYDDAQEFSHNRAIVKLNNKYAILNEKGNEITSFKYDHISDFKEGYASVKRDDLWAFIDIECNQITPFKYKDIYYKKDGYVLARGNRSRLVFINEKGEEVTGVYYDNIFGFNNSFSKVKLENNFGLVNKEGNEVIPCIYSRIEFMGDNSINARLDGRWYRFDSNGNASTVTTDVKDNSGNYVIGISVIIVIILFLIVFVGQQ